MLSYEESQIINVEVTPSFKRWSLISPSSAPKMLSLFAFQRIGNEREKSNPTNEETQQTVP